MTPPMMPPIAHPMTCGECLRLVATADVTELTTAAAVTAHCRTCVDCATLVDEVAEEARRLADLLDGTGPGVPSHVVALQAVAGSARERRRDRRRTRRLWAGLLVGGGLLAPVAALLVSRTAAPALARVETRTVELQCLNGEQAAELTRSALPAGVAVSFRPPVRLPVLVLSGTPADVATAARVVARIDARWAAERPAYCEFAPSVPRAR